MVRTGSSSSGRPRLSRILIVLTGVEVSGFTGNASRIASKVSADFGV